jgi:hypothetical protein
MFDGKGAVSKGSATVGDHHNEQRWIKVGADAFV